MNQPQYPKNNELGALKSDYKNNPAYARDLLGFIILFVLAGVIVAKPGIYSPKDYRNISVNFFCEADDLFDARIPVCHKRGYENGRRLSDLN